MTGTDDGGATSRSRRPLPPPVKHHVLTLPDHRLLSFGEYGAARGFPVVYCHGIPGSRYQRHPDESIAARAGARVIVPERPGYGKSSSATAPGTVADWAEDLVVLADHLALERFALAGVSGGVPYALAGAHRLRGRVTRLALVSGVAPDLLAHRLTPASRLTLHLARRGTAHAWLALPALFAAGTPHGYRRLWMWRAHGRDRSILGRPDVARIITEDVSAALTQGTAGLCRDLHCISRDWAFPLHQVRVPTAIWHGEADGSVPPSCADALAEALQARLTRVPGGGHLVVFELWSAVLGWLMAGARARLH